MLLLLGAFDALHCFFTELCFKLFFLKLLLQCIVVSLGIICVVLLLHQVFSTLPKTCCFGSFLKAYALLFQLQKLVFHLFRPFLAYSPLVISPILHCVPFDQNDVQNSVTMGSMNFHKLFLFYFSLSVFDQSTSTIVMKLLSFKLRGKVV